MNPAWLLPMVGDRKPQPLVDTPFGKDEFHFSPDTRFIAYHTDESERWEVYVAPMASLSEKRQISRDGGGQPLWRSDGKELFYLTRDGKLMAVDIRTQPTIEAGVPQRLFQTKIGFGTLGMGINMPSAPTGRDSSSMMSSLTQRNRSTSS